MDNIITNIERGSTSIDDGMVSLTDFLYDASFKHFGKTRRQTNKATQMPRNTTNNEWFNVDCRRKKTVFLDARRIYKRNPDDVNKVYLLNCRSEFCKTKRKAKRLFYANEKKLLCDLSTNEPKKFWKKVNKYRKRNNGVADTISLEEFVRHFQGVLNSPHTDNEYADISVNGINIDELDSPITETEVQKVIRAMKCNKSPGMDKLPAELFIDTEIIISPYLVRLFNVIFDCGVYPTSMVSLVLIRFQSRKGRQIECVKL